MYGMWQYGICKKKQLQQPDDTFQKLLYNVPDSRFSWSMDFLGYWTHRTAPLFVSINLLTLCILLACRKWLHKSMILSKLDGSSSGCKKPSGLHFYLFLGFLKHAIVIIRLSLLHQYYVSDRNQNADTWIPHASFALALGLHWLWVCIGSQIESNWISEWILQMEVSGPQHYLIVGLHSLLDWCSTPHIIQDVNMLKIIYIVLLGRSTF